MNPEEQPYIPVMPAWVGEILRRQKKQDIHAYLGQKKEWEDWKYSYSRKLKYARLNGWTVEPGNTDIRPYRKKKTN